MSRKVIFSLAISEEILGDGAPVLLQGSLVVSMEQAAQLGYDGVEIHIRNPVEFDGDALADTARRLGLVITAVGTGLEYSLGGLSFTSDDKEIRRQIAVRFRDHIDLAQKLDAVVFLGMCRGHSPNLALRKAYLDRLYQEVLPIAEYARRKGVILALEPIVFYLTNLLNTTEETLEFLERPGMEDIGLLLDTHHMFIEDIDMIKSFRMCRGRIAHIHISDSNRRYPGGGNIDFDAVGCILKEIEYDRTVSLEAVPNPSGEKAAQLALDWMKSVWQEDEK